MSVRCARGRCGTATATASSAPRSSSPTASTISPRTSSISCWPGSTARPPAPRASRCSSCPSSCRDADGAPGPAQRPALRLARAQAGHAGEPDLRHGLRRRRGCRGLPPRRGKPGHALHVHDDEQCAPRGRPSGPGPRRARLSAGAGLCARPHPGVARRAAGADRRASRRAAHAADDAGADRGDAGAWPTGPRPSSIAASAIPTPNERRTGGRPRGAADAAREGLAAPIWRRRSRRNAVLVHGGMGYIEETGAAQHLRDARILAIYEGTNGIQAMDLVGRKLDMAGGAAALAADRRAARGAADACRPTLTVSACGWRSTCWSAPPAICRRASRTIAQPARRLSSPVRDHARRLPPGTRRAGGSRCRRRCRLAGAGAVLSARRCCRRPWRWSSRSWPASGPLDPALAVCGLSPA